MSVFANQNKITEVIDSYQTSKEERADIDHIIISNQSIHETEIFEDDIKRYGNYNKDLPASLLNLKVIPQQIS